MGGFFTTKTQRPEETQRKLLVFFLYLCLGDEKHLEALTE